MEAPSIRTYAFILIVWLLSGCVSSPKDDLGEEASYKTLSTQELIFLTYKRDADAQFELGLRYEKGEGVPINATEMIYWHKQAAMLGHIDAQFRVGAYYALYGKQLNKKGETEDAKKMFLQAIESLERLANNGHAKAQHQLAVMYTNGNGVKVNWEAAEKWYRLAADQGDSLAAEHLAKAYYSGDKPGKVDYKIAAKYFHRAADKNLKLSQFFLALMYLEGHGVEQDNKKAFFWMRKAAENGLDHAQNKLGMMHSRGIGTESNQVLAAVWYRRAANQDHPLARRNLAIRYLHGKGVIKDRKEALRLDPSIEGPDSSQKKKIYRELEWNK